MNTSADRRIRNPWPYAIVGWFTIFVPAMIAWVAVAVHQKLDLVRPDYYHQEIQYQSQIDRLSRTAPVQSEVLISYLPAERKVTLRLPPGHLAQAPGLAGRVQFYRPSDAQLDFEVPLCPDAAGGQQVNTDRLRSGLWKIRVQWSAGGHEYFVDQSLVL